MKTIVDGVIRDMSEEEIKAWQALQALASNPVPPAVSSRQGQLALLDAGYLDDVEMMLASITDDTERKRAQIEFGATMWERSNPFLQQMWAGLGGDSDGLDDLFRAAINL